MNYNNSSERCTSHGTSYPTDVSRSWQKRRVCDPTDSEPLISSYPARTDDPELYAEDLTVTRSKCIDDNDDSMQLMYGTLFEC